jgi:hypothetical protein
LRTRPSLALLAVVSVLGGACGDGASKADFAMKTLDAAAPTSTDFATRVDLNPIDYDAGLPSGPNIVPFYVDGTFGSFNVGYITITICAPGTTTCQTIDHVSIDTGSVGLRLTASAINVDVLAALPVSQVGGQDLAECYTYASGYVFGSVRTADLSMSAELAPAMPLQLLGDITNVPTTCAQPGEPSLIDQLANGIMGVAGLTPDCGLRCTTTANQESPAYYGCTGGTCTTIGVPASQQLPNPVAALIADNNGYIIDLPAISDVVGGASPTGTMTFGIGTQANNALTATTIFDANASGGLIALSALNGGENVRYTVFDSGTPFYLLQLAGTPGCNGDYAGFFCPPSVTSFEMPLTDRNSFTAQFHFKVGNAADLFTNSPDDSTALDDIGADTGPGAGIIILGLPSFFGRRFFFGLADQSIGVHTGPIYAY